MVEDTDEEDQEEQRDGIPVISSEDGRRKKAKENEVTLNGREKTEDGREKTSDGRKKTTDGRKKMAEGQTMVEDTDEEGQEEQRYGIALFSSDDEKEEELTERKTRKEKRMTNEEFKTHIAQSRREAAASKDKKAAKELNKSKKDLENLPEPTPPHKQAEEMAWYPLPMRRQLALHANYMQDMMEEKLNDSTHRENLIDQLRHDLVAVWNRCHIEPRPLPRVREVIKRFIENKKVYCKHPKGDVINLPSKLLDVALCTCFVVVVVVVVVVVFCLILT